MRYLPILFLLFTGCSDPPEPSAEAKKIIDMLNDDDLPWTNEKLRGEITLRLAHVDVSTYGHVYYDQNYNCEAPLTKYHWKIKQAFEARVYRNKLQRLDEAAIQGLEQKIKLTKEKYK